MKLTQYLRDVANVVCDPHYIEQRYNDGADLGYELAMEAERDYHKPRVYAPKDMSNMFGIGDRDLLAHDDDDNRRSCPVAFMASLNSWRDNVWYTNLDDDGLVGVWSLTTFRNLNGMWRDGRMAWLPEGAIAYKVRTSQPAPVDATFPDTRDDVTPAVLVAMRKRYDLTQWGLAHATGIPQSTIANWEAGRVKPSQSSFVRLQQYYDERSRNDA